MKKRKVKACAFGDWGTGLTSEKNMQSMQKIGGALQNVGQTLGNQTGLSTGLGLASGVVGAIPGPIGAIGGTALGLTSGVASIFGANSAKKKQEQLQKQKERMDNANQAYSRSQVASDYLQDEYNEDSSVAAAANGEDNLQGAGNKVPVAVDNGEVIISRDGTVQTVKGKSGKTDNTLATLPEGSMIFSKKLGVADAIKPLANRIKTTKRAIDKTTDSQTAEAMQLNLKNDLAMAQQVAQVQEQIKEKRGIKDKSKQVTPDMSVSAFDAGTDNLYNKALSTPLPTFGFDDIVQQNLDNVGNNFNMQERYVAAPKKSRDYTGLISAAGTAANAVGDIALQMPYGLFNGTKETAEIEQPQYNLRAQGALNKLSQNRVDVNPQLTQLDTQSRIAQYNTRGSRGGSLAYRNQLATSKAANVANIYQQAQQQNNQYQSTAAQAALTLGEQDRAARINANDINARNRAAVSNYNRQKQTDLNNWQQNQIKMSNAKKKDSLLLDMLSPMMQEWMTTPQYNSVIKKAKR